MSRAAILITGAAGFIGSHLATRLLDEGHRVIGLDNLSAGTRANLDPRLTFVEADIRDAGIARHFAGVEAVFHLAARTCLPDCLRHPCETSDINVTGTVAVLEAARGAGVRKLIYADTSAAYEGVPELPSRVDRVCPIGPYAVSKRAGALFCQSYQRLHGLPVTILRYFNVYGPAQDWRRVIPPVMSAFILRLLRGERPTIYGSGEKRRDFVYVDDVNAFHLLALRDRATDGRVFNVGSGVNYSVNEVFALIEAELRTGLTPRHEPDLPGEAEATLADIADGRALGWEPKVDIREGLRRSIAYLRERVLGK
jgi:UDP-glucose 4-epimerase